MIQPILNKEGIAQLLAQKQAVLYFFVNWSTYAQQGLQIIEEVESLLSNRDSSAATFWSADISDLDSPAVFVAEWLKQQETSDLKMFKPVGSGNGSVAWLKEGKVVDFALSAYLLRAQELMNRTKHNFGYGGT